MNKLFPLKPGQLELMNFIPIVFVVKFILGVFSMSHQVLIPFVGDLASPERRASEVSFVLAGVTLGPLFGRMIGGLVCKYQSVATLYWITFSLQVRVSRLCGKKPFRDTIF